MDRPEYLKLLTQAFEVNPVVAILGPRQSGKTTLAKMYANESNHGQVVHFDLEDPVHARRLANPKLALEELEGLVIIDEIQRAPGLFELLRVLVDRRPNPSCFLILGSASRDLIRQSSETLAGRISYIELSPFSLPEVGFNQLRKIWIRGGFPPAFLAKSETISNDWRKSYISTFLERDIPSLGIAISPVELRRFWMMIAHYHGQLVNYSELGRSFNAADTTVRRYLDVLSSTFMVRQLPPWFENLKKRQVKSPKLYIRDSGIFHSLIGVSNYDEIHFHPKLGPSWEGFVIEEIIRKAQEEGKFDNLRGKGRPLTWEENPFEDPAWQMANKILKDGGFRPDWLEDEVELREKVTRARAALARTRDWRASELAALGTGDYYWRVRSENLGGASAYSTARLFTTGTQTGVEEIAGALPEQFELFQNYPNPFNPSTVIRYNIPMKAHVNITIFDVLGRAVATLVDEVQAASSYKVDWNATGMSSGMYFYRIHARSQDGSGDFTATKKLLLMR